MNKNPPSSRSSYAFAQHWFRAQSDKPYYIKTADPRQLSPILRSICVIDGTVTRLLSAYYLDQVHVKIFHQQQQTAQNCLSDQNWLDAQNSDLILNRSVQLSGETGQIYAHAFSNCNVSILPAQMTNSLEDNLQNIGQALLKYIPDNNRQLQWYGWISTDDALSNIAHFQHFAQTDSYLCRCYLVRQGNKPLIQIVECFPSTL